MGENIAQGQLPSETQIKHELDNTSQFLKNLETSSTTLEKEKVFHDTRKFVESVQDVIVEGGLGDRIQRFMADVGKLAEHTPLANEPKEAWIETRDFMMSLKDLVSDLTKSTQFRKSLVNLMKIIKDVVYDETQSRPGDKLEKDFVKNKSASETAKDVVSETVDALQELPKVEDLPEDKKKQIREQFKVMFGELNENPDTSFALRKFMKLWSRLNCELTFQLTRAEVDPEIRRVGLEGKQIIEVLSGKSLDDFLARLRETLKIIENDQELTAYLKEIKCYFTEALDKPQITQTEEFYDRVEEYIVRGRQLARKYRKQYNFNDLIDSANEIINGIASNEQFSNVQYRAAKLASDLTTTDIKGNTQLDFDLIKSMRTELAPYLLDRIKELPLPGFRISNESFEYLIVDDLFVQIDDILPELIRIHSRNDTDLTIKNFENPVKSESVVKVKIEGVRPKFNDFYFKFKRNNVLGVQDEGRADLKVTGSGLNIYLDFQIDVDSNNNAILGDFEVKVSVDGITLDITEANHKTLLNLVSPLFTQRLKNELESSIKMRMKQIAGDWSATINKRFLSTLPSLLPKSPVDSLTTKLVNTVIE